MAIYVDRLRSVPVSRAWRWPKAAHLLADDVDELHAFAKKIGLRRAWFQSGSTPHYDLHPARHAEALRLGATLADRSEVVALIRKHRYQLRIQYRWIRFDDIDDARLFEICATSFYEPIFDIQLPPAEQRD